MKKKLSFILVLLFVLSLFAGCGNGGSGSTSTGNNSAPTSTPATKAPDNTNNSGDTANSSTTEPKQEEGPYNLAAGKYDVDARGVPLSKYEYEGPLTTTDEVFTYWTSPVLADQIAEDYASMPYPAALAEKTGVHLEYLLVSMTQRSQNFAMLLASDDLPDLISDYSAYYPGAMETSVEENFSVNLYDYKEYMPNYYYCIWDHENDPNVRGKLMLNDHTIADFQCLNDECVTSYGGAVRGDWLDKLGIGVNDIITLDQLHDVIAAFQSQLNVEHPFVLLNCLDAHMYMNCFDTICQTTGTVAPLLVKDGKVQFACSGENDRNYMTTMNTWYNEGFISPNWMSWDGNITKAAELRAGAVGVTSMLPSEASGYVDTETYPDAYWTALHEPVLYKGQVFHLGDTASWLQGIGSWAITTRCSNIPLMVSYCDWFYSDSGAFFANYGVQGYTFEYNEEGKPQLTDFIVNNVGGSSWAILQFCLNDVYEAGILMRSRSFAFPGGEKLRAWYDIWNDPAYYQYDGSMAWPTAINLSAADNARLATIGVDIQTFITENYLQFVDGSKPLSEWDSYAEELTHMTGWEEALQIYQGYYDNFMASR